MHSLGLLSRIENHNKTRIHISMVVSDNCILLVLTKKDVDTSVLTCKIMIRRVLASAEYNLCNKFTILMSPSCDRIIFLLSNLHKYCLKIIYRHMKTEITNKNINCSGDKTILRININNIYPYFFFFLF